MHDSRRLQEAAGCCCFPFAGAADNSLVLRLLVSQRVCASFLTAVLLDRSIRNRFPYLDPLNHVQVELLKLHRTRSSSEKVLTGIQLTINGVSAGLRNSG